MAMFFANMNLTRRALKPSRGYSKCSSNRLAKTCVRTLMQTTEKGEEVFMREGTRNRSEVRTCLRHDTHGFSVTYGQDVRTNYRPGTDFRNFTPTDGLTR